MAIQRPSCFFNLCSSCSSRSNRRRRDCLLPPPRGRLCCRAGLTAPPYSHRWPSHPSTHPHLLLFSGDGRRTSKPSYSHTPLRVGNNCRVFPASVSSLPRPRRRPPPWCSRRGLVNMVNDRHASEVDCTWRGRQLGPRPHARKCLLITRKIMIPPPDIRDPPKGPLYFAKKTLPPLTARTHQLYLRTQGSASLLRTKKMNTPPASWAPPWWEDDLWAY